MFHRSKPRIGCLSSITNRWTYSSLFDVRKNDVRKNDLVNLVKVLLSSMFVRSKPKIGCSSSFYVRIMIFEFVLMLDKMVLDPSQSNTKVHHLFRVLFIFRKQDFHMSITLSMNLSTILTRWFLVLLSFHFLCTFVKTELDPLWREFQIPFSSPFFHLEV